MKKALIIGLLGLLCVAFFASLPKDLSGPPEVSAYPAPMSITVTPTGAYNAKMYLSVITGKECLAPETLKHGVAVSNGVSGDDARFLGSSWWYNYAANLNYIHDCTYVPYTEKEVTDLGQVPNSYNGYILMFNEPGQSGSGAGSVCVPAETAVSKYIFAKTAFPNAKIVVGGVFSYDSIDPQTDTNRTDCTQADNNWRKNFIEALAATSVPAMLPEYWSFHGYVDPENNGRNEVGELLSDWDRQMNPTMDARMVSWWNAVAPTQNHITSYSPRYWITEYNSQFHNLTQTPGVGTPTPDLRTPVSGEEQFEELYDWVNQELYRPTQIYRLDRAAVFNNRCSASYSWCAAFTMTNLLEWGSGIYATQVPTIRGAYFMNQMALLSMMYQPEEEEMGPQLEPFDPYPYPFAE